MKEYNIADFMFGLLFGVAVGVLSGFMIGVTTKGFYEKGYIQCLNDIRENRPPEYVLVKQKDGTTKWERQEQKK